MWDWVEPVFDSDDALGGIVYSSDFFFWVCRGGLLPSEFKENAETACAVLAIEVSAEGIRVTMTNTPAPGFSAITKKPVISEAALGCELESLRLPGGFVVRERGQLGGEGESLFGREDGWRDGEGCSEIVDAASDCG